MRYRVYSGPRGSAELAPLEKEKMLFKEFEHLDARWVGRSTWARAAASPF